MYVALGASAPLTAQWPYQINSWGAFHSEKFSVVFFLEVGNFSFDNIKHFFIPASFQDQGAEIQPREGNKANGYEELENF